MLKVTEPRKPLRFNHTDENACKAKRDDACNCVVARDLKTTFGNNLLEAHVLAQVTTLFWSGGVVQRYQTPKLLRDAIAHFDATGEWDLPHGTYELAPLAKSQTRKAQRKRAEERRLSGDSNMSKRYPYSGKLRKRPINPRVMNLRSLQASI